MLDINLFREEKGGDPEIVRESQRRRYASVEVVDEVIALDKEWRSKKYDLDQELKAFNKLNKEIAVKRKAKEDASELQEKSKELKKGIAAAEEAEKVAAAARDKALGPIGNLVPDTVPVDNNEDNNKVEKTWGTPRDDAKYNHVDLVNLLGIVDLESGTSVAGGRGYYLMNYGVLLNQALINYGLQYLTLRGYCPVHTPFFMRKDIMAECAQLSDFDEQLYKVTGEGDDKYLIATSEQTISSMHRRKWYELKDLPIRVAGYSSCFRKEVGSHGRDTLGIFRVHQFEKIEQFCLTSPFGDESWRMMDEMLKNSEDFYQSLGIPYQVVNIVSGALNDAAAKKFDLEASFPASKTFRELVSCSNCTDYQSRRLECRVRTSKGVIDKDKVYVHMLNSTLSATERTLCCLLENYQTPHGVRVPDVLQPFMLGIDFIPFVKDLDKKGNYVAKKVPVASGLFAPTDVFRVWFAPENALVGVRGCVEYLFKNCKVKQYVGKTTDEDVPEDAKGLCQGSDAVMAFDGKLYNHGVRILTMIATQAGSPLYPAGEGEKAEEARAKVDAALSWYDTATRNGGTTASKRTPLSPGRVVSEVLPKVESWLCESKFIGGKAMSVADVVFAAELRRGGKPIPQAAESKTVAKWIKAVCDAKTWPKNW